jgi:hypothetical protein
MARFPNCDAPGGLILGTNEATANTLAYRDNDGSLKAYRPTATQTLVSDGGFKADVDAKTANYTVTEADYAVAVSAASGAVTVSLPAASASENQIVIVKKTDATVNAVTVDGSGSETIDGQTTFILAMQYEAVTLQCDGTGWHVIDWYYPPITATISATATLTAAANIYLCTAAADITLTLPAAANWKNKTLIFKKVDAGTGDVILDGNASETIDGDATTATTIDTRYEMRAITSDGTNWHVTGASSPG